MSPFQEETMCAENKHPSRPMTTTSVGRQSPSSGESTDNTNIELGQHHQQQQQQQQQQRTNNIDANGGLHGGGHDGNNVRQRRTSPNNRNGQNDHSSSGKSKGLHQRQRSYSHSRTSKSKNSNSNESGSRTTSHNITNINKINVINNFGTSFGPREQLGLSWCTLRIALALLTIFWFGAMSVMLKTNGNGSIGHGHGNGGLLSPDNININNNSNGGNNNENKVAVGSKAAMNLPRWREMKMSDHIQLAAGVKVNTNDAGTITDDVHVPPVDDNADAADFMLSDNNEKINNNNNSEQPPIPAASMWELSMFGNAKPTDFQLYAPNAPSCSAPLAAENVSYTLVSQLSNDRVWMVRYHCERWGKDNPISIVVFSDRSAKDVKEELTKDGGCSEEQLTVKTVSKSKYDPSGTEYPVNILRNMAFSEVKTSHIVYADVDFWPASDLHSMLSSDDIKERFASDPKLATVIPVFQMYRRCKENKDCRATNIPAMPENKNSLLNLIKKKQASTFDPTNVGGHGSTKYITWRDQESGTFADLPCIKSNRYEPYLAFRYCDELPPFQEGFTGYGKNKMTWVMQLRRAGYLFSQLGGAFLVHYPHLDSKARLEWNKKPKAMTKGRFTASELLQNQGEVDGAQEIDWGSYKRARVDALFLDFKEWLDGTVEDESRVPMCQDALNDDVKLWVHSNKEAEGDDDEEEEGEETEEDDAEEKEYYDEDEAWEDYLASKQAYDKCQQKQTDNPTECLEAASDFIESSILWSIAGGETEELNTDMQMKYLLNAEQCAIKFLALKQQHKDIGIYADHSFQDLVAGLYVNMGRFEKSRSGGGETSIRLATQFVEKALELSPESKAALKMSRQLQQ